MTDNQPLLSIIIPCYNVESTIERTIDSVVNQTDMSLEVIAVDDGSIDGTLAVLQNISKNRTNIIVISQSNKGVSSARNKGLSIARGKYILFLDGDDIIEKGLVGSITKCNSDVILIGFDQQKEVSTIQQYIPFLSNNYINDYLLGKLFICVSSIIVSHNLLVNENIYFDEETYYSEDREYIVKCLFYANSVSVVPIILFHYLLNSGSVMHIKDYTSKTLTSIYAMERVYFLVSDNDKLAALINLNLTLILHLRHYFKSHCSDLKLKEILDYYSNTYIPKTNNMKALCGNRYSFFVYIMSNVWRIPSLFKLILKLLK